MDKVCETFTLEKHARQKSVCASVTLLCIPDVERMLDGDLGCGDHIMKQVR